MENPLAGLIGGSSSSDSESEQPEPQAALPATQPQVSVASSVGVPSSPKGEAEVAPLPIKKKAVTQSELDDFFEVGQSWAALDRGLVACW